MNYKALFLTLATLILASCSSNELKNQTPEEKKSEIYYGQGTKELVEKNYKPALTYLLQAKEFNPKDSKVRNNLGMAYYFRKQNELAEQELKAAISLDEKNSDARMNLGTLYMETKRNKEAREQFEKVSKDLIYPNQYRNYYNLAILSLEDGDRRSAFEFLAKSIKEKDDYCLAHYKLGELYAEEYRYQQALTAFKESGKGTCVSEPEPHYQQALALLNLNRVEEARKKFQDITETFSKSRYGALAAVQLKKITNMNEEQSTKRSNQTEVIQESKSATTPNF